MNKEFLRRAPLGALLLVSLYVLIAADISGTSASLPKPPMAKKVPKITEINGHKMVENYFLLRNKPNPEARAYQDRENV